MPRKSATARRAKSRPKKSVIRCAVIGYGAAFSMGRNHARWIAETPGLEPVAVCDVDASRLKDADKDFPGVETYTSVTTMLRKSDLDLVSIVTPHNTHAPLAVQCATAGKHVVVEKPMCITVAEADRMIAAAKASKVMLSVFHNRRWDGDFKTLRDIIGRGLIGDVFHIEAYGGGYGRPGKWWRSDKRISGGAFYDWGAHFVDWVLNLVPSKMDTIMGYFFDDLVWKGVSNEDQVEGIVRFANGAVANLQLSSIASVGKNRWRILGTKGGITDGRRDGHFLVVTDVQGMRAEMEVKHQPSNWEAYYQNIADHLLRGKELAVKPEEGRRVIQLIEGAEKASKAGKPIKPKYV
ncbi:MAG: Gfo/Idh/MocA family oxidoreductase [Armatimonadota bacterium]|nr:MAG: Gfo/Idh/MocA family oxidoreductase [Armatimonadota bacterium]